MIESLLIFKLIDLPAEAGQKSQNSLHLWLAQSLCVRQTDDPYAAQSVIVSSHLASLSEKYWLQLHSDIMV